MHAGRTKNFRWSAIMSEDFPQFSQEKCLSAGCAPLGISLVFLKKPACLYRSTMHSLHKVYILRQYLRSKERLQQKVNEFFF